MSTSRATPVVALLLAALACACSGYGVLQSAKSLPKGESTTVMAATLAFNDLPVACEEEPCGEGEPMKFVGPELEHRIGITDRFDFGIGTYLLGAQVGFTYEITEPSSSWGLAPRAGFGLGADLNGGSELAYAGAIGSYTPLPALTLYVSGSFINHWLQRGKPEWVKIPEGEREAPGSPWGDGLWQVAAGVAVNEHRRPALHLEYSYWTPEQDDPSDYYRFIASHFFSLGMGF